MQRKLRSIDEKIVRFIKEDTNNGFYIVSCNEYDQYLSITHTNHPELNLNIKMEIEPEMIQVLDVYAFQ